MDGKVICPDCEGKKGKMVHRPKSGTPDSDTE